MQIKVRVYASNSIMIESNSLQGLFMGSSITNKQWYEG